MLLSLGSFRFSSLLLLFSSTGFAADLDARLSGPKQGADQYWETLYLSRLAFRRIVAIFD